MNEELYQLLRELDEKGHIEDVMYEDYENLPSDIERIQFVQNLLSEIRRVEQKKYDKRTAQAIKLRNVLSSLTPKEEEIIRLRFGIGKKAVGLTKEEIAQEEQEWKKKEKEALEKLKRFGLDKYYERKVLEVAKQ